MIALYASSVISSTIFVVLAFMFFFSFSFRAKQKETAFAVSEWVRLDAVTLLEAIDTAARVNELLLAGEERVALGADFNAQLRLSGTRYESVAANAGHGRLLILRMDAFLHDFHLFRRDTIV